MSVEFIFTQLDTWFFKEARPMESIGGSQLSSTFPPTSATLSGAIRSLIGETIGIDWQKYHRKQAMNLHFELDPYAVIGDGEDTGDLSFSYPQVMAKKHGRWLELTPAPLDLLKTEAGNLVRLALPSEPIDCDLGLVRLPMIDSNERGAKPLENCWLLPSGWNDYKSGKQVALSEIVTIDDLIVQEARLGIAKDNDKNVALDGMLYQTNHIRMNTRKFEDIALKVIVSGLPAELSATLSENMQTVRFGGEGRLAFVEVNPIHQECKDEEPKSSQYKLVFNSPAYFDSSEGWLPKGAVKILADELPYDVWQFYLNGKVVKLVCQVSAKPVQVGGWDYAKRQPKPLRSFLPQGSCWYLQCEDELTQSDVNKIGELTQFGYGSATLISWKG